MAVMKTKLPNGAKRVQNFMAARGFAFEVWELPGSTRTAQEGAHSSGCTVARIAKSLVFREKHTDRPILVSAAGCNRVDVRKIRIATGLERAKADAKLVKAKTCFAIGGLPPESHIMPPEPFRIKPATIRQTVFPRPNWFARPFMPGRNIWLFKNLFLYSFASENENNVFFRKFIFINSAAAAQRLCSIPEKRKMALNSVQTGLWVWLH